MLSKGDLTLRAVNTIFLIIALGLSGSLAANTITQGNSQVNFCVFACAWALLTSSLYGVLAYFLSFLSSPLFLWVADFLNFIFTFAGATALAAALKAKSCSNSAYLKANSIAQGSSDRCRKGQADAAFLYFSVFIFLFSLVMQSINFIQNGPFGTAGSSKPASTGVPTMSQV